jgi:solute carrier family 9B (sodium/hydrogen exchanger), member 1/2
MAISLALLIIVGIFIKQILEKIKLPGLVGLLVVGLVFGPYVLDLLLPNLLDNSYDLRMIALIVILLRAGLELRRDDLRKIGWVALLLSVVPAIFEGVAITFLAPVFFDISYLEAALLGCILGAVSPAVVVPLMLEYIEKKKGVKKQIPQLMVGASAVDDVFVIVAFSIFLGIAKSPDEFTFSFYDVLKIPESLVLGIGIGVGVGFVLAMFFKRFTLNGVQLVLIILAVSIGLVWFENIIDEYIAFSALLAVMTIGFIQIERNQRIANTISAELSKIWIFAEILLFTLVGAQLDPSAFFATGLRGIGLILLGLIFRSIGVYLCLLLKSEYSLKEKLFCIFAYLPKATVQAAIGAIPLEVGIGSGGLILSIALLSIFLTAPLGAIAIRITGNRWLGD